MKNRREFLRSIASASVMVPAVSGAANVPTTDRFRHDAEKLAELMQVTCGGQWRVSVDQNMEFILVQKVLA